MTQRTWTLLAVLAIVILGAAAYSNSLGGAFVFDDETITGDAAIRKPWPPGPILNGPRPVLDLTFAANYALGKFDVTGYHLANLGIHVLAALALFGVVRRTLSTDRLRARFGPASAPLALAVALLWMAHPLQTESVAYVIQRAESLMGLLYLLTLYCAVRGFASPQRRLGWHAAAVLACAAGVGVKPVIASAPLIVLLYDRLFVSRSFIGSLKKSWALYLGLAATWGLLALHLWHSPPGKEAGLGLLQQVTAGQYALTELGVVARYLRLAFWPAPLCLDYRWPLAASLSEVIFPAVLIAALLVATLWAFRRRSPLAFPGLWFFIILAPTSSFMPITDAYFEHRMYLSLAAVVATVVLAAYAAGQWLLARLDLHDDARARAGRTAGFALVLLAAAVLGYLTSRRNLDYATPTSIWTDVVRKRPGNFRGHLGLAKGLASEGKSDAAAAELAKAHDLAPGDPQVYYAMGNLQLGAYGNFHEAILNYRRAVALDPDLYEAHYNLAAALTAVGDLLESIAEYQEVLRLQPWNAQAHNNIARLLVRRGRAQEAIGHYRAAIRCAPDAAAILVNFAWLRATAADPASRDGAEALRLAKRALELAGPADVRALDALAAAYAESGQFQAAALEADRAAQTAQHLGQQALATLIRARLRLYRNLQPFHEPPAAEPEPMPPLSSGPSTH